MTQPLLPAGGEPPVYEVLWSHTDTDGDSCRLLAGSARPYSGPVSAVAHFTFGPGPVNLSRGSVERLRAACDRLLADPDERLSDAGLEVVGRAVVVQASAISQTVLGLISAQHARDDDSGDLILSGLLTAVANLAQQIEHLASAVGRVP